MTEEYTFQCILCKKSIPDGKSMWSVTINHETVDDSGISVHSSDCYLVFCEECAEKKDFRRIVVPDRIS